MRKIKTAITMVFLVGTTIASFWVVGLAAWSSARSVKKADPADDWVTALVSQDVTAWPQHEQIAFAQKVQHRFQLKDTWQPKWHALSQEEQHKALDQAGFLACVWFLAKSKQFAAAPEEEKEQLVQRQARQVAEWGTLLSDLTPVGEMPIRPMNFWSVQQMAMKIVAFKDTCTPEDQQAINEYWAAIQSQLLRGRRGIDD